MKRSAPLGKEAEISNKRPRIELVVDDLILKNGLGDTLGKEGLLNVFKHSVGRDIGIAARVCKYWESLIMDTRSQKTILFRAVQSCYIENICINEDFRLARSTCEKLFRSESIQELDVAYFRDLEQEIVERMLASKNMVGKFSSGLHYEHPDCRMVISHVLYGLCKEGAIFQTSLGTFEGHVKEVFAILLDGIKEAELNKGYGIFIIVLLERIMPLVNERTKIKVIRLLIDNLIIRNQTILTIMEQEGLRFYRFLKNIPSICEDMINITKLLGGLMALEFSKRNSRHQNDYWFLFLEYECHEKELNHVINWANFGLPIIEFLESNNKAFIDCCRSNIMRFVIFLGKLLFDKKNINKYSILCGLNLLIKHEDVNAGEEEKFQGRLILEEYFKNKFSGMGIEMEYRTICNLPIDEFNKDKFAKIASYLGKFVCDFENLEIYISRVPEKLISLYTEEKKQDILNLFRAKISSKESVRLIEEGFNIYLDFFNKLYFNSSLKVKQETILLIGEMVLNLSYKYSNQAWVVFLQLIYQEPNNIFYVCRVIASSEGMLSNKKMHFAQKIRDSFIQQDRGFIECFNVHTDKFLRFLDDELLNIRQISIKVDVSLTLIYIAIAENVNNNEACRNKIKGYLINQLKWTPKLRAEIKKEICKIKKIYNPERLNVFLTELNIK